MSATHIGTCQCCGRSQKLPNGRLSKHGYTVQWGFFSGTCRGAHELPYEQSCGLIQRFIDEAKAAIAAIKKRQDELRASTGTKAWFRHYRTSYTRGVRSGYYWEEGQVSVEIKTIDPKNGDKPFSYPVVSIDIGSEKVDLSRHAAEYAHAKTAEEAAKILNGLRADALDKDIANLEGYISWQTPRVTDWKPGKLTPVK